MSIETLSTVALFLAGIPACLFLLNLLAYQCLPLRKGSSQPEVSVLIPARNEEKNIMESLASVLASKGVELEVIVLDDNSTDRTLSLARQVQENDSRLVVASAPGLPPGWCGKQHACQLLSTIASKPLLLFLDADVRLTPDAIARMARQLEESGTDLLSGVPRQITQSFSEKLLIPLIHFVLLGFLPMHWARRNRRPAFAAGCGQLFMARARAYKTAGGHAAIRTSLHDGLQLPRAFRKVGLRTAIFDATDIAWCRMYQGDAEVWAGLAKNATEGLGAQRTILPMTLLLLGGQVLPWVLMLSYAVLTPVARIQALAAAVFSIVPRLIAVARFRQPLSGALLHPLAVLSLLGIQWLALLRAISGRSSTWKGRCYPARQQSRSGIGSGSAFQPKATAAMVRLAVVFACAVPAFADPPMGVIATQLTAAKLSDQTGRSHRFAFPSEKPVVLVLADRKGSEQVATWVKALRSKDTGKCAPIIAVADLSAVPGWLRGRVQASLHKEQSHPVMLDWAGGVVKILKPMANVANVYVLDRQGEIKGKVVGPATAKGELTVQEAIEACL